MYIKNQSFNDEETLLEMIFDFSLGEASPCIQDQVQTILADLEHNTAYQEYRETLQEEDRMELEAEERDIRLAEALQEQFDSFKVRDQQLFGLKGDKETLLYSIDMV